MSWLWSMFTTWLSGFIGYLFNPAQWLEVASGLTGYFFQLVGSLLPGAVGTKLQGMGEFLQDVQIENAFRAGLYFMSPACEPTIFLACVAIIINAYLVSLLIKLAFLIKNHVWSAGA